MFAERKLDIVVTSARSCDIEKTSPHYKDVMSCCETDLSPAGTGPNDVKYRQLPCVVSDTGNVSLSPGFSSDRIDTCSPLSESVSDDTDLFSTHSVMHDDGREKRSAESRRKVDVDRVDHTDGGVDSEQDVVVTDQNCNNKLLSSDCRHGLSVDHNQNENASFHDDETSLCAEREDPSVECSVDDSLLQSEPMALDTDITTDSVPAVNAVVTVRKIAALINSLVIKMASKVKYL